MSDKDVFRRFGRLKRALGLAVAKKLKPLSIGPKQAYILLSVSEHGPLSLARLSEFTTSDPAAISRSVDVLVEHGLAERKDSSTDRRAWQVKMTRKGHETAAKISRLIRTLETEALKGFSETEVKAFMGLLGRLTENAIKIQ